MKSNFKSLEFIYQDTQIHFLFSQDENVMVNATDMAKVFNKSPKDFLRTDATKKLIECFCADENFNKIFNLGEDNMPRQERKNYLVNVKANGKNAGTYMHRYLAFEFAGWLEPNFKIWILHTIDQLLFGNAKKLGSKITEVENNKQKVAELRNAIIQSGNETALQFLETIENLKKTEYQKKKAFAQFSNQFKLFL